LFNGSGAVLPDGERDEASAGFLRNVPPDQPLNPGIPFDAEPVVFASERPAK
jgi:hypothetical protein